MTVTEWFMIALLVLAVALVCLAAAVEFGPRPIYSSTMTVRQDAEPEQKERYRATRRTQR